MNTLAENVVDKIHLAHCIEGMRRLPGDCIPLTVTSPPYDGLRNFGGNELDGETFELVADELYRVTMPGGVVVWVVADAIVDGSETGTSARQKLRFLEVGFRIHHTMIMDRAGARWPCKVRYGDSLEYAFILSKGRPRTINLLRDRPNTHTGKSQDFRRRERDGRVTKAGRGRPVASSGHRRAIWRYAAGWGLTTKDHLAFEHSALMPEAMATDHIHSWSRPGDLVLDPFCGAATTCKMALLAHRRFLGFEIHEPYFELALRRMRDAEAEYRRRLDALLIGA